MKISIFGHENTFALNRFKDKSAYITTCKSFLKCFQIIEWYSETIREQRLIPLPELFISVYRKRTESQSMESMVAVNNFVPPGCLSGKFESSFNSLSSGISEKDRFKVTGGKFSKLFSKHSRQHAEVHLDKAGCFGINSFMQNLSNMRMVTPDIIDPEPGKKIENIFSFCIGKICSFG